MFNARVRPLVAALLAVVGLTLSQTAVFAGNVPLYDANVFIDDFNAPIPNGLKDVGESTAFINPASDPPALPAISSLLGPIVSGTVTGQFDITCDGGTATTGCGDVNNPSDVSYAVNTHDFGWAILDATDSNNPFYLSNGSQTFFASNNFTAINYANATQVNRRFLSFSFDISGSGLSLLPGRTYAFVSVLADDGTLAAQTNVPGEGNSWDEPAFASYITATSNYFTDSATFQLHDSAAQSYFDYNTGVFGTQVVTSRLVPIVEVPEPATAFLLIAAGSLVIGRRSRRTK